MLQNISLTKSVIGRCQCLFSIRKRKITIGSEFIETSGRIQTFLERVIWSFTVSKFSINSSLSDFCGVGIIKRETHLSSYDIAHYFCFKLKSYRIWKMCRKQKLFSVQNWCLILHSYASASSKNAWHDTNPFLIMLLVHILEFPVILVCVLKKFLKFAPAPAM